MPNVTTELFTIVCIKTSHIRPFIADLKNYNFLTLMPECHKYLCNLGGPMFNVNKFLVFVFTMFLTVTASANCFLNVDDKAVEFKPADDGRFLIGTLTYKGILFSAYDRAGIRIKISAPTGSFVTIFLKDTTDDNGASISVSEDMVAGVTSNDAFNFNISCPVSN